MEHLRQLATQFRSVIFGLAVLLLVRVPTSAAQDQRRSITLALGKDQMVSLPRAANVHVSRRGIVDLRYVDSTPDGDSDRWQVTALRQGLVLVSAQPEESDSNEQILIRVFDPNDKNHPSPKRQVTRDPIIESEPEPADPLLFHVKVFLVRDAQSASSGWTSDASQTLAFGKSPITAISTKWQSMAASNQLKIIGEPVIRLNMGDEASLSDGGEIFTGGPKDSDDHIKSRKTGSWKAYGLQVGFTPLPHNETTTLVKFSMSLKTPSLNDDAFMLKGSGMRTTFVLPYASPMIVGGISTSSQGNGNEESPFFSRIPIIGPLFRLDRNNADHGQLYVWILAAKDDLTQREGIAPVEWPKAGKE